MHMGMANFALLVFIRLFSLVFMFLLRLTVDFHLHGCRSLKDKRRRLARLRDKFGQKTHVAVCESDHADSHTRSQWSFVLVASAAKVVEQAASEIELYVASSIDAEITNMQRQWLA